MDSNTFAHFCQVKGLRPVQKIEDRYADIFIAETDWEKPTKEHPLGFYQVAWAVAGKASKGKLDIARALDFDAFHDMDKDWDQSTKHKARINEAIADARRFVEANVKTGRYG